MATPSRRPNPSVGRDAPVAKLLTEEPYRFDFFQAVRLLEWLYPDRQPVGGDADPSQEVARFRTRASIEFPASEIHRLTFEGPEGNRQAQLMVTFMGLTGQLGVLPTHYTELLIERLRYRDTALWEFLDIFNHRLLSLFYRAWEKYRFPISYERDGEDRFSRYLFSLGGFGTDGLRGRSSVPDEAFAYYGGLLAQSPHSASAIEAVLSDHLGVPVSVEQFRGQWLQLSDDSLSRLGQANCRLGQDAVAGRRVWDVQSKFRLRIGPLALREFVDLLPDGTAFRQATDLTRLFAGLEFDFDIQLLLRASEVPPCALSSRAEAGARLGWTSWLRTRPFKDDDSQVILHVG